MECLAGDTEVTGGFTGILFGLGIVENNPFQL